MIQIGLFSKMSQTGIKTLRYYDEKDLLKPVFVDCMTGYRYYSSEQLFYLHRINCLKQIGFPLNEIRKILGGADESGLLAHQKQRLQQEISNSKKSCSTWSTTIKTRRTP